jgi:hypothetical protein
MSGDRNEKPHLLIAKVEVWGSYPGIKWSVECPYESDDTRDCGVIEECTGSSEDMEKWGCGPVPQEPSSKEVAQDMAHSGEDMSPEMREAWDVYEDALEEWRDDHIYYGEGYGHRSGECWFIHTLSEGDVEPETILAGIPDGTPIVSPFLVSVHYDGSFDEAEPNFTLWKEASDDDPS